MLVSFVVRGLYVMDGLKNYTLIVLNVPFDCYITSSFCMNAFYVLKNVLIGYQLNEIKELVTQEKTWDQFEAPEKVFFCALILIIVFSFIATGLFTFWANQKMKSGSQILYQMMGFGVWIWLF